MERDGYYWKLRVKGGPGSGHWGHAGRPGKVGGSLPGGGHWTLLKQKCPIDNPVAVEICKRLTREAEERGDLPRAEGVQEEQERRKEETGRWRNDWDHQRKVEYILERRLRCRSDALREEAEPVLRSVLEELPSRHLDLVRDCTFRLSRNLWTQDSPAGSTVGHYVDWGRTIELDDEWNKRNVWAHEIGHAIQYSRLMRRRFGDPQIAGATNKWHEAWQSFYETMPTRYAQKNNREGFAECYELYFMGTLKRWDRPYSSGTYRREQVLYNMFDSLFQGDPLKMYMETRSIWDMTEQEIWPGS